MRTRLDDFAWNDRHVQCPFIEVLDRKLASSERRQEVNLCLTEEIIPLSLEPRVRLFFEHDDHISRHDPRRLIALPVEFDLLARFHPLVDMDLQHLPLRIRLLPIACLAPVFRVHHLACPLALIARLLNLLHHRSELTKHHLDTLSAARCAGLDRALLAASTFTGLADNRFRKR